MQVWMNEWSVESARGVVSLKRAVRESRVNCMCVVGLGVLSYAARVLFFQ
jgi:hypothetical protein